MGFSIDYMKEMYEKSYKEAVALFDKKNYVLAKKKFLETATFLNKLARLDPINESLYNKKAARILEVASKIEENNNINNQPRTSYHQGSATPALDDRTGDYKPESNNSYQPSSSYQEQASTNVLDEDMSQYFTFYDVSSLKEGFESVVGLDQAKETVRDYVINPILYPEAYHYNFLENKCILLEGPPGTGKTTFAKAVAKEINRPFALVNVASLINCYVGETGKTIDKLFAYFREYARVNHTGLTIFFDEFDEIAKSRSGDDKGSQTAVPALLRNLEGMSENGDFLILANTNHKELLDSGILSRFRRKIYIPLPDFNARLIFLKKKLKDIEEDIFDSLDLELLANALDGASGREITQACDEFKYFISGVRAGIKQSNGYTEDFMTIIQNLNSEK